MLSAKSARVEAFVSIERRRRRFEDDAIVSTLAVSAARYDGVREVEPWLCAGSATLTVMLGAGGALGATAEPGAGSCGGAGGGVASGDANELPMKSEFGVPWLAWPIDMPLGASEDTSVDGSYDEYTLSAPCDFVELSRPLELATGGASEPQWSSLRTNAVRVPCCGFDVVSGMAFSVAGGRSTRLNWLEVIRSQPAMSKSRVYVA